jgi:hypothetical protein
MKIIIVGLFIGIGFLFNAQVKKRDQGQYKGILSAYNINTSQDLIEVDSSIIYIKIEKSTFVIKIDDIEYHGTYRISKRDKRNYLLKAKTEYSDIEEEFILFGKDKKLKRKGIFPQPDAVLHKLKKKEFLW